MAATSGDRAEGPARADPRWVALYASMASSAVVYKGEEPLSGRALPSTASSYLRFASSARRLDGAGHKFR
eukprot:scaffold726_cov262-Pinguiococcus_pyrenoidosus.AAC.16